MHYFSLTLNPNLPDWAISSFITATYHQLIVSNLRHGEVHEVPACDVDLPVDVASLSEHDLENQNFCDLHIELGIGLRTNKRNTLLDKTDKQKAFHTYLVVQWEGNIAKPVILDMIPPHIQPLSSPGNVAPHPGRVWWCCTQNKIIYENHICISL